MKLRYFFAKRFKIINIQKILSSKTILFKMSTDMFKDCISMVNYKLQKPFRSKLLNHKVEYFTFNSFIKNRNILFRHRENAAFLDF